MALIIRDKNFEFNSLEVQKINTPIHTIELFIDTADTIKKLPWLIALLFKKSNINIRIEIPQILEDELVRAIKIPYVKHIKFSNGFKIIYILTLKPIGENTAHFDGLKKCLKTYPNVHIVCFYEYAHYLTLMLKHILDIHCLGISEHDEKKSHIHVDTFEKEFVPNDEDIYILICVHSCKTQMPKNYIVYQVEQFDASFVKWKSYKNILDGAIMILDYSISNIKKLYTQDRMNRVVWTPMWKFNDDIELHNHKKIIDVCFIGTITARRSKILNLLSLKYKIFFANHLKQIAFWEAIAKSKIILNMHAGDNYTILEMGRICRLIGSNVPIVSEISESIIDDFFHILSLPNIFWCTYDNIINVIEYLLSAKITHIADDPLLSYQKLLSWGSSA